MDPKKIDLRSNTRRIEAETTELSEAELSGVSGGKPSSVLMQACATGKHFATVKLTV
jgi:hypothetical protein